MNSNSNNFREMFWDESNRLRVVNDNNNQLQHYIYDAAGERTLKASSQIESVYENGQIDASSTTIGLYTTYVSPYMVVDANQRYSKHYFNGSQRVASKMGEQDIAIFENGNQYLKQANSKATENTPFTDFETLKTKQISDLSYYLSKSTDKTTARNFNIKFKEFKKQDIETQQITENNSAYAAPQYAELYYYHSDHLGTGTFLSDFEGNPYQFFLNLPFGETMAEQHSYSGDYTNRYKFNGKELDEETGFYYYGARYYNPKFSIWLSIDPLAEEFPDMSPYNYCGNNPISNIDPDGRYFFGLFGSSSDQRRQMRAERFAEKVGGSVVSNQNGKPSVNYNFQNSSDGTLTFTNTSKFGDFSSWKNAKETLVGFEKSLSAGGTNYGNGDGEYTGTTGMREFSDDLGKGSTYVKVVGVVVTASSIAVGPEVAPIGMGIYEAGDAMDKGSTMLAVGAEMLAVGADLKEGKIKDAGIRIGAEIIDSKVGKKLDASSLNNVQKFGGKAVSDALLDKTKGALIE